MDQRKLIEGKNYYQDRFVKINRVSLLVGYEKYLLLGQVILAYKLPRILELPLKGGEIRTSVKLTLFDTAIKHAPS